MQTNNTIKRNYWVTTTENGEMFEERQGFKTWKEALDFLNHFITEKPMSITVIENGETVKTYHYRQRVAIQA